VGTQLETLTLGVLGMGRIGRRVARVADAMGLRVLANDLLTPAELGLEEGHGGWEDVRDDGERRGPRESGRLPDPLATFVDKSTLYAESDILTIHVDGRPENRGMIDTAMLDQIKPTCLLINAARGMLVDNAALASWAERCEASGGAAVLDVHDPEPPDADYPLLGRSNVKLLPHLASRTPQAMANMSWVVRDVVAVLGGRAPKHPAV
jgi:D-3-phosphoglycerate dehydrogenase